MSNCLTCQTPCVQINNKLSNNTTIHGDLVMACKYANSLPSGDLGQIMDELQEQVRYAQQHLSLPLLDAQNAFNNVRVLYCLVIVNVLPLRGCLVPP